MPTATRPEGGDGDPGFGLDRFVSAQDAAGTFHRALEELRAGCKRSHWMWFVFPQIAGLGRSEMAERFAISSLAEAKAYIGHPVLGPRLVECTQAVLVSADATGRSAEEMLGPIDALKLRSSMTLFHEAAPERPEFGQVLDRLYRGHPDRATIERLEAGHR